MEGDRRDWNELAELDPLWAVLSDPSRKGGRWDVAEFLETGERELDDALNWAAELGLPQERGTALDVGCGVGRVTHALAAHFHACLGVDASPAMVGHAERLNADRPNNKFRVLPATELASLGEKQFDLVWSVLVLQHLPPAEVERTIALFSSLLRPGGLAIFQLPFATRRLHRLELSRRLYRLGRGVGASADLLLRRTPLTPMRMTAFDEPHVRRLVEAAGGELLLSEPYGDQSLPTPSRLYFVSRAS